VPTINRRVIQVEDPIDISSEVSNSAPSRVVNLRARRPIASGDAVAIGPDTNIGSGNEKSTVLYIPRENRYVTLDVSDLDGVPFYGNEKEGFEFQFHTTTTNWVGYFKLAHNASVGTVPVWSHEGGWVALLVRPSNDGDATGPKMVAGMFFFDHEGSPTGGKVLGVPSTGGLYTAVGAIARGLVTYSTGSGTSRTTGWYIHDGFLYCRLDQTNNHRVVRFEVSPDSGNLVDPGNIWFGTGVPNESGPCDQGTLIFEETGSIINAANTMHGVNATHQTLATVGQPALMYKGTIEATDQDFLDLFIDPIRSYRPGGANELGSVGNERPQWASFGVEDDLFWYSWSFIGGTDRDTDADGTPEWFTRGFIGVEREGDSIDIYEFENEDEDMELLSSWKNGTSIYSLWFNDDDDNVYLHTFDLLEPVENPAEPCTWPGLPPNMVALEGEKVRLRRFAASRVLQGFVQQLNRFMPALLPTEGVTALGRDMQVHGQVKNVAVTQAANSLVTKKFAEDNLP
jgi:hypothetical protein